MELKELFEEKLKKDRMANIDYKITALKYECIYMIVNARHEKGLSQKELAELAGITQSNVSRFEVNDSFPSIPKLQRLAVAMGKELHIELRDLKERYSE